MIRNFALLPLVTAFLLAGCQPESTVASAIAPASTEVTHVPPTYTPDEWKRDFANAFERKDVKVDENGITSYTSCLVMANDQCTLFNGMKDGFRKVDHLTPMGTVLYSIANAHSMVRVRVVVPECKGALVAIEPFFSGRNGWLFLNKVAFMADGDVVYENAAAFDELKRNNEGARVQESWVFSLDKEASKAMERFSQAKSQIIRFSGDKGYFSVPQDSVNVFADDVVKAVEATRLINASLTDGGGPKCNP